MVEEDDVIPDNKGATVGVNAAPFYYPDNERAPFYPKVAACEGCWKDPPRDAEYSGYTLNSAARGLRYQVWRFWVENGAVVTLSDRTREYAVLYTLPAGEVTEVTACMDGNMQPVIAFMHDGLMRLYHYDASYPGFVTDSFPGCVSPRVGFDDKRDLQVNLDESDPLLLYLRDGLCYWRQGRERFTVERLFCTPPPGTLRIGRIGMAKNMRFQVEFLVER